MSLGATMAWTICTNRAGVWISRSTLVFLTVASVEILSRSTIFERFLLFESITASAAGYGAGYGGGSRMRRYITLYLTLSSSCCGTMANLVLLLTAVDCVFLTLVLLEMPQSFIIKLYSETQVSGRLGMSGGISPRHAQNPLSGERRKTLSITHHALSPPPSHHHLYIIHLIN